MTPADLRALAADHAHIRHHPHEVAAALLAAAELIEHGQRRVAELIGVADALSAELRDALQGGEPVAWQWRKKDQPWSLDMTFNAEVYATTQDSEVRPLYAAPQPVEPKGEDWRDHVEHRLLSWRQEQMNPDGDRMALDDYMGADEIADLIDYVCDEYAEPQPVEQRKPLSDREIDTAVRINFHFDTSIEDMGRSVARWVERMHGIVEAT